MAGFSPSGRYNAYSGGVRDVRGGRRQGGCWSNHPRRPRRKGVTLKKSHDYIHYYRSY
jgi:hypothetical protein